MRWSERSNELESASSTRPYYGYTYTTRTYRGKLWTGADADVGRVSGVA